MISNPSVVIPHHEDPLTASERQRISAALATISSRTLLQSLVGLCQMNEDAKLIIADLIERLPPDQPG